MPNVKTGKIGTNSHLEFVLNENNAKIVCSACLLQLKDKKKRELKQRTCKGFEMAFLEGESVTSL